jgi:arylsulfatase A-like enzyme
VAAAVLAIAGLGWWGAVREKSWTLPPTVTIDDPVADLSRSLDGATVLTGAATDPVRIGEIRPGNRVAGQGERPGLIMPPPARVRFALDVPEGGVLRFGVGVQGDGRHDTQRSGVRFALSVDGREVWTRTVNPAATRRDRRWFDERIDLGAVAGRSAEIALATEAEHPGRTLAGTPGFGDVRLVRETKVPRQVGSAAAPNVLVLLVDTLRADRLGCYGASPSPSPNLDKLAGGGLVFAQAIAQSSWTLPSVSTLFTGLHPRSHGAIGDDGDGDDQAAWGYLAGGVVTWAEQASRAGITTVGMSANPLVSRGTNLAQGFETFVELPWDPKTRRWSAAAEVNRRFLDWLTANRKHRFVAWLQYMEPHDPYTPPPAMRPSPPPGMRADLAAGWILDLSRQLGAHSAPPLPPDQIAYLRALYDGEIRSWDAELPTLLDGLARLGLRESTMVVVTADHGEEFQEHGLLLHRAHLYDELLRVPLVIAGPGIAPGRRTDQVQGIDLFPTLAALLGIAAPPDLPGRSVFTEGPERPAVSETDGLANDGTRVDLVAVRRPPWKMIYAPARSSTEVYDLGTDPGEHQPLGVETGEGPSLRRILDDFGRTARPAPPRTGRDPALHEKLRALGYAE